MICMSASATASLIDKLSDDFDHEVLYWRDRLMEKIDVSHTNSMRMTIYSSYTFRQMMEEWL